MSQFFASGGQSIGASASTSVLPMNIQGCFPLGFPCGSAGKESSCNAGDPVPLEKGRLLTPVLWPGEFHVLYSPWGRKESDTAAETRQTA